MQLKSLFKVGFPSLLILLLLGYMINPAGTYSKDPRARLIGFMPYRIPSDSMTPTLARGDYILVNTFSYALRPPERGDIVVFSYPIQPDVVYVKRVIGLPGEHIELRNQRVILDGTLQREDYLQSHRAFRSAKRAHNEVVPEGNLLMLGDNRDQSRDGRDMGYVPMQNIIGEVTRIWKSNDDKRVGPLDLEQRPVAAGLRPASQ